MDIEQEGDSLSTTVSKENTLVLPPNGHDDQNQKFGLEAQGAQTDEANEESEISGASAVNKKKKKKNRRRRNKNRNNCTNDNDNVSKVASNETLMSSQDDKPLVVTTYICSSSELDSVRKLIDENGNPLTSFMTPISPSISIDPNNILEECVQIAEKINAAADAEPSVETNSNSNSIDKEQKDEECSIVDVNLEKEKVTSKCSVNVIYKVGAAVFENHSFTGSQESSPPTVNTLCNDREDKTRSSPPDASMSENPIERYEKPTQPSLGELWMSDTPNNESVNKLEIQVQEPRENELVNTDDIILNDNLINNNYLQEREPQPQKNQDLHKVNLIDNDVGLVTLSPSAERAFKCNSEENSLYRGLTVPNPSVENSAGLMDMNLVVHAPLLYPHTLARIAHCKRENPDLVVFAQNAVKDILQSAQSIVDGFEKYENSCDDSNQNSIHSVATTNKVKVEGNWLIDQSLIEDVFTESEIDETVAARRRSKLLKNLWNCFGKRRKSMRGTLVTTVQGETSEAPQSRPKERSQYKSLTRSTLPRRKQ